MPRSASLLRRRLAWASLVLAVAIVAAIPHARNVAVRVRDHFSDKGMFVTEKSLLRKGEKAWKTVAITIDDGPHENSCPKMLDAFAAEQVTATFFVVGSRVQKEPSLVRRMIAEGHEVGNHTMTHRRLDSLSAGEVRQELLGCDNAVRHAVGRDLTLFRPPGMRSNTMVLNVARSLGYTTIDWTTGAKDFTGVSETGMQIEPSPQVIAERVLANAHNGSIILLHDTKATALAMPTILRGLKVEGYQIVTLSQMLASLPRPIFVAANPVSKRSVVKAPPKKGKPRRDFVRGAKKPKRIDSDNLRLEDQTPNEYLEVESANLQA